MLDAATRPETKDTDETRRSNVLRGEIRWIYPVSRQSDGTVLEAAGSRVALESGMTFGRDPECSVCLTEPGASRLHARVVRDGPILVIEDCNSTNGVFVNGERVSQAALTPGTLLRIGGRLGLVERRGEPTATDDEPLPGLLAGSRLRQVLWPAQRIARSQLPVVIVGATGTGKEVVARWLHQQSERQGRFVALNCASLPEELAECQLFGARKGAFTGAVHNTQGFFRTAHRGTLLLDEVQDLAAASQPKLLRVLQQKEVLPVGETVPIAVDVRVVVASQTPLPQLVAAGKLRADLAMRLSGFEVELPTLEQRREDVPLLFEHFLRTAGGDLVLDVAAAETLCCYAWPGNVRELEMVARRCVAEHPGQKRLLTRDLPEKVRPSQPSVSSLGHSRAEAERRHLAVALTQAHGNLAGACRAIGMSRPRAYRLLAGKSVGEFLRSHEPQLESAALRSNRS